MNNSKEIIELISRLRKEKNMSVEKLAKKVGIAKSTLSRYETKKREFPVNDIGKYADALGVSIEYLLGLKKTKNDEKRGYTYLPTSISAGAPILAEPIEEYEAEKITLPDSVMGKWAGHKDIFIMRVNGDSMNKVMPHNSLIAVKEVELSQLKNGDIVVYSDGSDYAVKRFYMYDDELIFRPDSEDLRFSEMRIPKNEAENIKIHGKVVLYIVELD